MEENHEGKEQAILVEKDPADNPGGLGEDAAGRQGPDGIGFKIGITNKFSGNELLPNQKAAQNEQRDSIF